MKKPKTNIEFVKDLMNFSPYGGLSQVFVIQAIQYYCQEVTNQMTDEWLKADEERRDGKMSLINNRAWRGVAEDINKRLKHRSDDV
jgi:hypothetical protein